MKLLQHGQNLWQLTRLTAFNSYLLREADGLTLIDTGLEKTGKDIFLAAEQIGLPIRRIALTHAHTDHVGSLDEVASQLPQAEVAFTERTAEFLQGKLELRPDEPQDKLRGGFVRRATRPTRYLVDGDHLGSLRVIDAPGHAPDQIVFWDERDGTLIAGDAFQTKAGTAVAGTMRWLFPFPALATWHPPTALATAKKLLAMEPNRLAVGHGRVIENPLAEMQAAIREAEAKHGVQTQAA